MQAYEFSSTTKNGIIHIPDIYRDKVPSNVKVIIIAQDDKKDKSDFSAFRVKTKGFKFDREEANER